MAKRRKNHINNCGRAGRHLKICGPDKRRCLRKPCSHSSYLRWQDSLLGLPLSKHQHSLTIMAHIGFDSSYVAQICCFGTNRGMWLIMAKTAKAGYNIPWHSGSLAWLVRGFYNLFLINTLLLVQMCKFVDLDSNLLGWHNFTMLTWIRWADPNWEMWLTFMEVTQSNFIVIQIQIGDQFSVALNQSSFQHRKICTQLFFQKVVFRK